MHRLAEDPSIRENAQRAFESARRAIDRLSRARNPAKALIDDRKLQAELRTAIEAVRDASVALTEGPRRARRRRRCRVCRLVGLLGVGAAAALAASEDLRGKALDLIFGAEEEFQYTPPSEYSQPGDSAAGDGAAEAGAGDGAAEAGAQPSTPSDGGD